MLLLLIALAMLVWLVKIATNRNDDDHCGRGGRSRSRPGSYPAGSYSSGGYSGGGYSVVVIAVAPVTAVVLEVAFRFCTVAQL